jgi:hypothetical protein
MVTAKHNKAKKKKPKKFQIGMKHCIQQIGTGGQKATLIMPLKNSEESPNGDTV